jgi:hypothetical protein
MTLQLLFELLHKREVFFRFENDEDGYILSIIDRSGYPRVWADNFRDGQMRIIAESADNTINRTVMGEKDWIARFTVETIEQCVVEFNEWDKQNRLPKLK